MQIHSDDLVVDALDIGVVHDYDRLINHFGISPIAELLPDLPSTNRHYFMERGIMFGHSDLDRVFTAIDNKDPFTVMTGIKPSGGYHIGSLSTVAEVIYFQKLGAKVSFCIADIESYITGTPLDQAKQNAIDNITDLLAMGLSFDPDDTFIYRQSQDQVVQHYSHILGKFTTLNAMRGTYGDKHVLGYYQAVMVQVADILRPQLVEQPMVTVTPVGADQAPHARLTRDIAQKEEVQQQYGVIKPSFTYHKMLAGIDGSAKMSKSKPFSSFSLDDSVKAINKIINHALTGGKDTAAEQRQLGGDPGNCRVFDLFAFMFEPDQQDLEERRISCQQGDLLCGPCKSDLKAAVDEFRNEHIEKKESMIDLSRELLNDRII